MTEESSTPRPALSPLGGGRWLLPAACCLLLTALTVGQLRIQGRCWRCDCGGQLWWSGDIWGKHNSQHWFDPYSFTHLLHGVFFGGLLVLTTPKWSARRRTVLAVALECWWEIVENSPTVIERYRATTIALGYEGDSVINSVGDILSCTVGFGIAYSLGWRRSILLFVSVEVLLLAWIRDNLTLNVIMLLCPLDAIKAWQTEG